MDTYWLEMYAKVKMYEWVCGTVFGVVLFSLYIIIKILESGLTKRAADGFCRLASKVRGAFRRR